MKKCVAISVDRKEQMLPKIEKWISLFIEQSHVIEKIDFSDDFTVANLHYQEKGD